MRIRILFALLAAVVLLPGAASASERILGSGKLDGGAHSKFSCSVVNKNDSGSIQVTPSLKDKDGNTAFDQRNFAPATLTTTIAPGKAAMLVKPATFPLGESLYCWALVPETATVFGNFVVVDPWGTATAATSLEEDLTDRFFRLLLKAQEIENEIDWLQGNDL